MLRRKSRQEEPRRDVQQGWTTIRLGDACSKIGSGATPRGGKEAYFEDGPVSLIRSQNVHNDRFRLDGLARISYLQASKLDNVTVQADDVLLNITGDSVARSCQVAADILPARVNQHVAILRPNPKILSASFLRYVLIAPSMQSRLLSLAHSGGTRKALTKRDIESLNIQIPRSVTTQEATVRILKTLDAKIEFHLHASRTLEVIASSSFKSWFIDFDPVRVQAEDPKLSLQHGPAELFPHRLSSSELGPIPESWTIEPLSEVVDHLQETEHPSDSPNAQFNHYSIPAYDSGTVPVEQCGSSIKSHKALVKPGTVLISRLNPEIERVWLPRVSKGERAVCSTEFMVLMPRLPFTSSYLYCLARSRRFRRDLESLVTGTSKSHQRAPSKSVMSMNVIVPPTEMVAAFDQYANGLLERVLTHRLEASLLVSIRDHLLPRLIGDEGHGYTANDRNSRSNS